MTKNNFSGWAWTATSHEMRIARVIYANLPATKKEIEFMLRRKSEKVRLKVMMMLASKS